MSIELYGWDNHFSREWETRCPGETWVPARIVADYGQFLRAAAAFGKIPAKRPVNKPGCDVQVAVGDWVALEPIGGQETWALIHLVLPRKTKFSRAAAGIEVKEQVVAANVDTVFLMQSLNRDFNMRRLERYLIAAWESGAAPVIVLTKSDLCDDLPQKLATARRTAPGVPLHALSCITGEGLQKIQPYIGQGKTVAFLGSSGVGKSTLANRFLGEEILGTREIREGDGRGRHATTRRELLLLPGGGMILDTPGMRSLSPWKAEAGMEALYGDVEKLVTLCRFRDCRHREEPGCAVREALEAGRLEPKRWEHWLKLQKELEYLEARKEGKLRLKEKQWGRQFAKLQKERHKGGRGYKDEYTR